MSQRVRRRLDAAAGWSAILAVVVSLATAAVSYSERADNATRVCRQVDRLRADVVTILRAVETVSSRTIQQRHDLTARERAERLAQIHQFYGSQIARVQPTRCE